MDEEKHKKLTGCPNSNILAMAQEISNLGINLWIRHVLVPDLTDDEEGLADLKHFIDGLKTVKRVEILPYHTLGLFKWEKLGIKYPLEGVNPPSEEAVAKAEKILGIEKVSQK